MARKKKMVEKDEPKVHRHRRRTERQDELGRELGDSTPMAPPVGYKREPTISERIRNMVRGEALRQAAEAAGVETFAEADDFEVEDDDTFDPSTPYEEVFDPIPSPPTRGDDKKPVPEFTPDTPKDGDRTPPSPASPPPVKTE